MKTKLVLCLSIALLGAAHVSAVTPEQRAKIEKFFELVQMQKQHEARITAEVSGWPEGMSLEGLKEEERAAMQQSLQQAREFLLAEAAWSKVKDDLVEVYAKRFSEEEMDRILQLLDNDTGRMLYRKQAELAPEVHAVGESRLKAVLPQAMAIFSAPAVNRAKAISCVNNLKQIGLTFRLWAQDNDDLFPFAVSTNNGGTRELCARVAGGADRNAFHHFLVMSNELGTPKILVCPSDADKKPALRFSDLQAGNVSYLVFSGTNVDQGSPGEILARCPVHGHVLHADGGVQQNKGAAPR
jgi:hypothetical protein